MPISQMTLPWRYIYMERVRGLYTYLGDQDKALQYLREASQANKRLGSNSMEAFLQNGIGESYRITGKYQEALKHINYLTG